MIGQISASNQLRTSSELAPNMFGASSELASVIELGFNATRVAVKINYDDHTYPSAEFINRASRSTQ